MGKRELVVLLNLSSWCLVMVEWLFLAVPWDCLRFVIVVFPEHTHLLLLNSKHWVPYSEVILFQLYEGSNHINTFISFSSFLLYGIFIYFL